MCSCVGVLVYVCIAVLLYFYRHVGNLLCWSLGVLVLGPLIGRLVSWYVGTLVGWCIRVSVLCYIVVLACVSIRVLVY